MIRRTLMRRAYNAGHWSKARTIAMKLVHIPKEQILAQSIIIRSLYNEEIDEVIQLNLQWEDRFAYLVEKINNPKSKSPADISRISEFNLNNQNQRSKFHSMKLLWIISSRRESTVDALSTWVCILGHAKFLLNRYTHPDLLRLTVNLALPLVPSMRTDFEKTRSRQTISLSFSAGIDSTAPMLVMPQSTLLGYHRRSFDIILDHRNADRLSQHLQHEETDY